ncbi:MAG: bifunctional diguanylate cyclase/phosphodiesterase [Lachnospiraceae bacterium]|nr:bifunctional diguanylate cyclase/phosphodiesterase [Lachnospiraceae bacterium]
MDRINDNLVKQAIDLNDIIVFEYDHNRDLITFSDNINKYIPVSSNISSFVENIAIRGKIHADDVQKAIAFFTMPAEEGKVKLEYVRFLDFSGEFFWYQLKGRMKGDEEDGAGDDKMYGTMTYIDDEAKHRSEEMEKNKDSLTHVFNKESFFRFVDEYLGTKSKEVIPNLMLVDVDDYDDWKEINSDISADGVLVEIARILKRAFRGSDLIGRLGKDRFAVFMKGIRTVNVLEERAAYVEQTVRDVWKELNGAITVSIGIAMMSGDGASVEGLTDRALAALDDAKRSGKDTYVMYNENMERMEKSVNPILTTKEMELVTNILDPMCSWAYAVDEDYHVLYRNDMLKDRLSDGSMGLCYMQIKGYDEPCPDCPLKSMEKSVSSYDSEIYSTSLRCPVQSRTTRISLRNGKNIYLIASVNENVKMQEEELNESKVRVRTSLMAMQNVIWDVDLDRNSCIRVKEENIKSVMDKRIKNYQTLREYFADKVVCPEDKGIFLEGTDPKYLKQAKHLGHSIVCREIRLKNVEGEFEWYNLYSVISADDRLRVLIIFLNVDEYIRHRFENIETKVKYEIMKQKSDILKEMALSNERHENVNEMTGILVYEYYVSDDTFYVCPMFDEIFDIDVKTLKGTWAIIDQLKPYEDDKDHFDKYVEKIKASSQTLKTTIRLYNRNNVPIWYTIIIQPLHGLNNMPVRYLATFQNVDAEMRVKAEMEYRADYDSLTGLYNAEAFYRKVEKYVHLNEDKQMAIISVDIDKFRIINDRYGIDAGNKCLGIMGKCLKQVLRKDLYACRYQADVFNLIIDYSSEQDLLDFMTELSEKMRKDPDIPAPVSLVYGIYKIVDINVPARLMCDRARAVKRQLKGTAISNYAVYDDVIRLKMREQAEIENEMEQALKKGQFEMFLQPQINIKTGKICGAEALVRWRHPTKGILVPAHFLSLFEDNGFITKLDSFMWEEASRYIVELQKRDIMLPISVNVSRRHIGETDIVDVLTGLVKKYGFENRYLEIEITENLFMDDVSELFEEMGELKSLGFRILMDDFGSGYSSLNMLRKAPIDTMKIDRFFLDEIMSTERGKIIVESSVRMAKMIGLDVIAEGVETKEQLDFLRSIDCDMAQGYYYSRPIPVNEFEEFIKEYL